MKALILLGSPRRGRNTDTLAGFFCDELQRCGADVLTLAVPEMTIAPCRGCYACQQVTGVYGCAQKDDMERVTAELAKADLVVLATPIYSWYCPTALKSLIDRLYGMQKYYGSGMGRLWKDGVRVALLLTHGYEQAYAAGPFMQGIENLCKHDHLGYAGAYSVRDLDDLASFTTPEAEAGARAFAHTLFDPQ